MKAHRIAKQVIGIVASLLLCLGADQYLAAPKQDKKESPAQTSSSKKTARTPSRKTKQTSSSKKTTQTSPPKKTAGATSSKETAETSSSKETAQTVSENERTRAASLVVKACEWAENHDAIVQHRAYIDSLIARGYHTNYVTRDMFERDYIKYLRNLHNIAAAKLGTMPSADVSLVEKYFPSAVWVISEYKTSIPTCLPCTPGTWQQNCPWFKSKVNDQNN